MRSKSNIEHHSPFHRDLFATWASSRPDNTHNAYFIKLYLDLDIFKKIKYGTQKPSANICNRNGTQYSALKYSAYLIQGRWCCKIVIISKQTHIHRKMRSTMVAPANPIPGLSRPGNTYIHILTTFFFQVNPGWLVAPLILLLHLFLDCASFCDRPKLSMSFLTQSHQVFFRRPLCLIPSTSHVWPSHYNLFKPSHP